MPKRIPRFVGEHLPGAYLMLVCSAALCFAVLLILYQNQADKTQALAKQSLELSHEIQQQRRENIRGTCLAQNEKHMELENFLRTQDITPASNPTAFQFIDTLAPVQNCDEVVKAATTTTTTP